MRRFLVTTVAVTGMAVAACSSSNSPPSLGGTKGSGDAGLDGGSSGASSSGSSGASGSSGSSGASSGSLDGSTTEPDGAAPRDGGPSDAESSPPSDASMNDPTCSPNTTYGSPTNVPGIPTFAAQPLVTMTNDELTMAWVVNAGGSQGTVYVADRTSSTADFGGANTVPSSSTASTYLDDGAVIMDGGDSYFAFDRVALSSDGLTLIGVAVGNHALAQFQRPDRTSAFTATPAEQPFSTLEQTLMPGEMLGDPVLGANGEDLVYSKYGLSPTLTVYESFLAGQTWPAGSGQSATALAEASSKRKRPTSLTADRRTLFVWDEAGEAYGVLRETPTSQFNYAIPFGNRYSIQVNGDCTRLYYVNAVSGGYALVQAQAM